jgi:hypothetical protein
MQNEIWSLISFMGPPSWFITFSPELRAPDDCYHLIVNNLVAGARFFSFYGGVLY